MRIERDNSYGFTTIVEKIYYKIQFVRINKPIYKRIILILPNVILK